MNVKPEFKHLKQIVKEINYLRLLTFFHESTIIKRISDPIFAGHYSLMYVKESNNLSC